MNAGRQPPKTTSANKLVRTLQGDYSLTECLRQRQEDQVEQEQKAQEKAEGRWLFKGKQGASSSSRGKRATIQKWIIERNMNQPVDLLPLSPVKAFQVVGILRKFGSMW